MTVAVSACQQRAKYTLCGVPVQGTVWHFAAELHDHGDGSFTPTEVFTHTHDVKCNINGYALVHSEDVPATVLCDMKNGNVIFAVLMLNDTIIEPTPLRQWNK